MQNLLKHPLYGRRVLHILSPVRWVAHIWQHSSDSNYRAVERTIEWLPFCHHYVLIPQKNDLLGNKDSGGKEVTIDNITYIKFSYPSSVLMNRGHFAMTDFTHWLEPHIREFDFDYVFVHQPEIMYNIQNALQVCRMGPALKKFIFFHWVDCSDSQPVTEFPKGYLRQLEGINLCDKAFFHGETAVNYLRSNWDDEQITTGLNENFLKHKLVWMPTSSILPSILSRNIKPKPIPLPNKKILLFNHRWANSTGAQRLVKYTQDLNRNEYIVWVTDTHALKPRVGNPAPDWMKVQALDIAEYIYLLQNVYATLMFVDGYATWNLSVQDGIIFKKPAIVFNHPIVEEVLGKNYPFYFKNKNEFINMLETVKDKNHFDWKLPDHDSVFRKNLIDAMIETIHIQQREPNGAVEWLYHLLNLGDCGFKRHLLYNTHPSLISGNSFERIRAWCMNQGVMDDPTSKYTRLWIPQDKVGDIKKILNGKIFKETKKDPAFVVSNERFW